MQAGQVLVGGVQDPLGTVEHLRECIQRPRRDRVDEERAAAGAPQLNEIGVLPVSEARGSFGVDGDGPCTLRQGRRGAAEGGWRVRDRGQSVARARVGHDVVGRDR